MLIGKNKMLENECREKENYCHVSIEKKKVRRGEKRRRKKEGLSEKGEKTFH